MEGDRNTVFCFRDSFSFQSTPSAWRETTPAYRNGHKHHNFNPLPPHGGRPDRAEELADPVHISIHSLRMEGDPTDLTLSLIASSFQSTPSAWRETVGVLHLCKVRCGIRFQSTPSAWRETRLWFNCNPDSPISIHSLRMEGDIGFVNYIAAQTNFNPLPPHGGRRSSVSRWMISLHFNPLPPHGGRPQDARRHQYADRISIHSLRMEGDWRRLRSVGAAGRFQSTPSAWRET